MSVSPFSLYLYHSFNLLFFSFSCSYCFLYKNDLCSNPGMERHSSLLHSFRTAPGTQWVSDPAAAGQYDDFLQTLSLTLRLLMLYIYIYMEHLFLMFLDHTQRRTAVGRTPLDEWSARRRDLYLTTHDTHNRQISMPPVGFEPTISAGERPAVYLETALYASVPPPIIRGANNCIYSVWYLSDRY